MCAFENLHYQISREKFEPELGLEQSLFSLNNLVEYRIHVLKVKLVRKRLTDGK